ncbi:MAG: biotin--[acetyl-CoA-carboxylase] ligase [Chloroflexi bacterium]|nr:biotin--[acetyl-CoA-carboxylase] ligase [Chloroflexota bacterium]
MDSDRDLPLSVDLIRDGLDTAVFGQVVVYIPVVSSTNDVARDLASYGAPEGTLVVADAQTAGRGRLGRRWQALARCSLLCSLVMRPRLTPSESFRVTALLAVAIARAVESCHQIPTGLKWPNDVMLNGLKLAGVLAESSLLGSQLEYVIAGFGINVNLTRSDLKPLPEATSLRAVLGYATDRATLLRQVLREIEGLLPSLPPPGASPTAKTPAVGSDSLLEEWRRRLVTLGQPVTVSGPGESFDAFALDVTPTGSLLVKRANGPVIAVAAGDVTLRGGARPH